MPVDAERIRSTGRLMILAVDQSPFDVRSVGDRWNTFCVLQPLLSLEGEQVEDARTEFPNRGRVWWMVRDEHAAAYLKPGTLWCGCIERAPQYDESDPESDLYQVQALEMRPATGQVVEVIDVPVPRPRVEELLSGVHFAERPPTASRVLVRGSELTLGPFSSVLAPDGSGMMLGSSKPGESTVFEIPTRLLPDLVPIHAFEITLNHYARRDKLLTHRASLVLEERIPYDRLRNEGYARDAATDAQVLNYCLNRLGFTRAERTEFKKLLNKAQEGLSRLEQDADEGRVARFRRLIADGESLAAMGEDAAQALADALPELQRFLERHADALVANRVEMMAAQRSIEIESKIAQERKRLEKIQGEIARAQTDYERRAAQLEAEFKSQQAERLASLELREKQIEERSTDVARTEAGIRERLERVIALYREEGERVADQLLSQLPLLGAVGVGGPAAAAESSARPQVLPRPAWLTRERASEPVAEGDFLDQLRHVLRHRGFLFDEDDVLNFHTCVKTGGLTVLAGPSGRGKSSLPWLYAEALGCGEEYLTIPVRSDWLDDRDLVGAYNALSGRFEPAPSGLVDRLIAANQDEAEGRGGIFLVCLDEMNLARVEHYFASFLSVLEAPPERRQLQLFAEGLQRADDVYAPYRRLHIPENVRIVGTVNIDETTHFFSPKVLDRSNLVSLKAPVLNAAPLRARTEEAIGGLTAVHSADWLSWMGRPEEAGDVASFVAKLDGLLADSRVSLGYRVLRRVQAYVAAARDYFPMEKALDFQVVQSVLPKLRRSAPSFPTTLKRLREELPPARFPRSAAILERLGEAGVEDDLLQLL